MATQKARIRAINVHFASIQRSRTGLIVCTFVHEMPANQRFGGLNWMLSFLARLGRLLRPKKFFRLV